MRIVVTGRSGQLARVLAAQARGCPDIEIVPVGRPQLDLEAAGSAECAIAAACPDVVVNCAAYTAVDRAEAEPERAFRINADGAGEVARAAREAGAPIIQISTDYVFDGAASRPYGEQAPTEPLNVYGRSKLAGEDSVRAANPNHLIARTAWLYSPLGSNFVRTLMHRAAEGEAIDVVADQFGSPTSALDLSDALLAIVARWRTAPDAGIGEVLHLVGQGEASWFDLAVAVMDEAQAIGRPSVPVRPAAAVSRPAGAARPTRSTLDGSRFARVFDFRMPAWRDSLRPVVRFLATEDRMTRQ